MRTSFPSMMPILGDQHAASKATQRLSACAEVASSDFRIARADLRRLPGGSHEASHEALAVSNLKRSLADGMGLPTEGIIGQEFEDGAVVFFHLNDDLILALYPAASLSKDASA